MAQFDFGSVGDLSGWGGGVAAPQEKVTNLSAHVDGGQPSSYGTNGGTDKATKMTMYHSIGYIAVAVLFLWVSGAVIFRNHNL